MTISTEELRKLLNEAIPGEWIHVNGGLFFRDKHEGTFPIPYAIAAEVIRLRKALVSIEQHYTDTDLAAKHMAAIARAALNKEMK